MHFSCTFLMKRHFAQQHGNAQIAMGVQQDIPPCIHLFCRRKFILADAAKRAFKVSGNILPRGAGGDACFGHSDGGIILPAAHVAFVLHTDCLFFYGLLIRSLEAQTGST